MQDQDLEQSKQLLIPNWAFKRFCLCDFVDDHADMVDHVVSCIGYNSRSLSGFRANHLKLKTAKSVRYFLEFYGLVFNRLS